ncbi:iron-binding protein [Thioclava sp. SK-1]|uniref:ABC transporter substrate-binding protein n=1 Tax=Thioclava sp. SK-1 TaxID=1889770 RepID=UPI000825A4E9|nr:extracellular solute-binding protein [Thioclava sp. SK-1]OCX65935.1 iron-binding protein [Thioclava sp. SK-1]
MIKVITLAVAFLVAAPVHAQEASGDYGHGPLHMVLRSTTDMAIMRPAMQAFVRANPDLTLRYEQWGSNALTAKTQAECQSGTASADAVFSSAVHQLVELVNSACAQSYRSDLTAGLPASRNWRDELWGLTHEAAVIAYNRAMVGVDDAPHTRFALLDLMRRGDPAYRGKIATYDIEASGLGYLFAFADSQEATTFGSLLEGFARSDAVATCCSAEILQGVADGQYLIAYNVLGSYVPDGLDSRIGVIMPEDYTLFLSRAFMIPKGAPRPRFAARLLDFLLSAEGQRILTENGLIVQRDSDQNSLPESAERPIRIEPSLLVARDQHQQARFIAQWRQTFSEAP